MTVLSRDALQDSPLADLHAIASELAIDGFRRLRKNELVDAILEHQGGEGGAARPGAAAARPTAGGPRRPRGRAARGRGTRPAEDRGKGGGAAPAEGEVEPAAEA